MLATADAYGLKFNVPAGDTAVGASLRTHGEFARAELDFLLACTGEAPGIFLDVGANLGAIAAPFADARPEWKVLAVEAHQGLSSLLKSNALANGLSNIEVVHAAAGAEARDVLYPSADLEQVGNYGDIGLHYPAHQCQTPTRMVRLDDLAPSNVRLVKVDVQGYEPQVLAGSRRLLETDRPIWMVEASRDAAVCRSVAQTLQSAGYDLYWFYSPFVMVDALRGGRPADPGRGDPNIVAMPVGSPPPLPMTRVSSPDEVRPGHIDFYPYLKAYGF